MKTVLTTAAMLLLIVPVDVALAQTTQDRIDAATARAREAGVPVALLESKVAEGKAKGISMDRIAVAVERREAALEKASQALRGGPEIGPADLAVAADALESGVSTEVLKALADTAPRDRRVVAIAALTELVRQGRVPEAALDRVKDALKRGPDALANLPAQAAAAGQNNAGGQSTTHDGSNAGQGRGGAQGPPASVPAPGTSTEPTKPGSSKPDKPVNPGKPTTTPAPAVGRGGGR
jgi:hypothetical protein